MSYNLMLHSGANTATRDDVFGTDTPDPTDTHFPVPHAALVETVERHIHNSGFEVVREEYGLWNEGMRMFGVWALTNGQEDKDFQLAIGLRNAHDKSFSAGMAVGSRVFVCDNLAFSAEIVIARKHTRFIMRDLDRMVAEASGKIAAARISQEQRIAAYKATEISDATAHDIVVRAVDAHVMANSYIPKVLGQWREPAHEEFLPRTAWSLFNGFTEELKAINPLNLTHRTVRLHGLMDGFTNAFGTEAATPDFGEALGRMADPQEIVL